LTLSHGATQSVYAGGTAINTVLNLNGQQGVFAGGVASGTTANSGGGQYGLGGTITNTTVNNSGYQDVESGSATHTTVNGGGSQYVFGGTVADTTINNGYQDVESGSVVTNTTLNSGSFSYVGGGTVTGTAINDGAIQDVQGGTVIGTVVSGLTAEQDVDSGGTVSGSTIYSGLQLIDGGTSFDTSVIGTTAVQQVVSGSAVGTTVAGGGVQSVFSSGVASATTIGSGGIQSVSSGGFAVGTTVSSGGQQNVFSGGVVSAATIDSGGTQYVSSGGTAIDSVIVAGQQSVFSGGVASGSTISGGQQNVYAGGVASATVVSSGGAQLLSGGTSFATNLTSGGVQYVSSGGSANATTLGTGATQTIGSGGTASSTAVNGGTQQVFAGGVANATAVGRGGVQIVSSGGSALATSVSSGGMQIVNSGGVTSGTTVANGGMQNVASGGMTVGAIVSSGGVQAIASGGVTQATLVQRGGTIANDGTIIFTPTAISTFDGTISGSGKVLQQGVGTTVLTGDNHAFAGVTTVMSGTLLVGESGDTGASLGGNVAVLSAGTLRGHGAIGGDIANIGTVMPGGTIGTLTVAGNYTQSSNGALVIEVSPTSGSQLRVGGTATLGGTLQILYDPGSYSARSYAILTASAINGRFGSVSSTVSAGADLNGLMQSVNYGPTELDLLLAQSTPSSAIRTIGPLNTSIHTALGSTVARGAQAFDTALLGRLVHALVAGRGGNHDGTWATLTDGYFRGSGNDAASSFGAHRSGFAAGVDRQVGDGRVGIAIGYEHDEIGEATTPDSGKIDAARVAAYGSRMLGPIATSAVFGYGFNWASEKRPFGAGANLTPEGHNRLQELSGTVQAGLPLELSSTTVLEPRAGLHWAWVHGQGFAESGGGGQDLVVGADTVHSAQPYVGLTLMHAFGEADKPVGVHLDVDYAREIAGRRRMVTVFSQDGTAFPARGASFAHQIVSVGAGVYAQAGRSWSISGDASTQFREGSMVHLQLRYAF
jgi:autotransporter passenger strand-loop-strand repeat protein